MVDFLLALLLPVTVKLMLVIGDCRFARRVSGAIEGDHFPLPVTLEFEWAALAFRRVVQAAADRNIQAVGKGFVIKILIGILSVVGRAVHFAAFADVIIERRTEIGCQRTRSGSCSGIAAEEPAAVVVCLGQRHDVVVVPAVEHDLFAQIAELGQTGSAVRTAACLIEGGEQHGGQDRDDRDDDEEFDQGKLVLRFLHDILLVG